MTSEWTPPSLAGPFDAKLAAIRRAGFSQVMISASEVVGHPGGVDAGIRAVRDSGLAVTGLETLRDFEGLDGKLRDYKVDVAKSMLQLCQDLGGRLLIVEASTASHANTDADAIVRDLRALAMLAIPKGVTHCVQRCFVESDSRQPCCGGRTRASGQLSEPRTRHRCLRHPGRTDTA